MSPSAGRPPIRPLPLLCVAALVVTAACGSSDAFQLQNNPVIELSRDRIAFSRSAAAAGGTFFEVLTIRNTGEAVLELKGVSLQVDATPDGGEPAFWIEDGEIPAAGTKVAPTGRGEELGLPEQVTAMIHYRPPATGIARTGRLTIDNNDPQNREAKVELVEELPSSALQVIPDVVVFQDAKVGKFAEKSLTLINTGASPVRVMQLQLVGALEFDVLVDPEDEGSMLSDAEPVQLNPPLLIEAGRSYTMTVRFTPVDEDPREAQLNILSDDPALAGGLAVRILGNPSGPCVRVEPEALDFNRVAVGRTAALPLILRSCGSEAVEIKSVTLSIDGHSDFDLLSDTFINNGAPAAWPGTGDAPTLLPVNGEASFQVSFTPQALSALDDAGNPIPETTKVVIEANTGNGVVEVEVQGIGADLTCPTSVITIVQGSDEVPPQTVLRLSGENSVPANGQVVEWRWSVQQPTGGAGFFVPTASSSVVDFEANVAGAYSFFLEVRDAEAWSCEPAERQILVVPDEAIHIELVWQTPRDTEPQDTVGADMDLHFVHLNQALANPNGANAYPPGNAKDNVPEGYFNPDWDIYFGYASHDWGQPGLQEDNPSLDRDDVDGFGPENLNLNVPEDGVTYRVGVHYWSSQSLVSDPTSPFPLFSVQEMGPSTPTTRIFIFGKLKEELTGCPMAQDDLWDVGAIHWPSQFVDVYTCDGPTPTGGGGAWPERPCGKPGIHGAGCTSVIMPNYRENTEADIPLGGGGGGGGGGGFGFP